MTAVAPRVMPANCVAFTDHGTVPWVDDTAPLMTHGDVLCVTPTAAAETTHGEVPCVALSAPLTGIGKVDDTACSVPETMIPFTIAVVGAVVPVGPTPGILVTVELTAQTPD